MKLTSEQIATFKALYEREYRRPITEDEAEMKAQLLLELFRLLLSPPSGKPGTLLPILPPSPQSLRSERARRRAGNGLS